MSDGERPEGGMHIPDEVRREAMRMAEDGKEAVEIVRYLQATIGPLGRVQSMHCMMKIFQIPFDPAVFLTGWTGFGDGSIGDDEVNTSLRAYLTAGSDSSRRPP